MEEIYKTSTAPDFLEMLDIFARKKDYTDIFYEDTKIVDEEPRWLKSFINSKM